MTEEESRERVRFHAGWVALRNACNKQHPRGPGGCAVCVCGAGGGGSEACSMLAVLRDLIRYMPTESLPAEWRRRVETLQEIIF